MTTQAEIDNTAVLGNAGNLVAEIVLAVAGNDISNHLEGEQIKGEALGGIAQAIFNKEHGGIDNA